MRGERDPTHKLRFGLARPPYRRPFLFPSFQTTSQRMSRIDPVRLDPPSLVVRRGRRALAIAGTIVSGLAMVLSFILPWFTGAFWLLGVVEDSGVIERLETWTPTPRATDRFTDPAVTAPTGTGPDETPAPTESTPAVPTETITP